SRGIDIKEINMVINYDVPHDAEDYVHRIGRTARANTKGEAYTLVSGPDIPKLRRIEKLIEMEIPRLQLPEEFGPVPELKVQDPNASASANPKKKKKKFFKKRKPGEGSKPQAAQSN
ncbi:MAG: C-terminal helicase domain-containing protein, partial [Crocinitomicaceae bacterium]|nr:C-terminal helicase domain-containing protein [Crocinitomicaceae bacterium]